MNFRVLPALYAQISESAHREGRSISEEVEARILRTFYQEEVQRQRFGDPDVVFLANWFAAAINLAQARTGKKFYEDAKTLAAVRASMEHILETNVFEDANVAAMQKRFDLDALRLSKEVHDCAEFASIEPDKRLSLDDIMKK